MKKLFIAAVFLFPVCVVAQQVELIRATNFDYGIFDKELKNTGDFIWANDDKIYFARAGESKKLYYFGQLDVKTMVIKALTAPSVMAYEPYRLYQFRDLSGGNPGESILVRAPYKSDLASRFGFMSVEDGVLKLTDTWLDGLGEGPYCSENREHMYIIERRPEDSQMKYRIVYYTAPYGMDEPQTYSFSLKDDENVSPFLVKAVVSGSGKLAVLVKNVRRSQSLILCNGIRPLYPG